MKARSLARVVIAVALLAAPTSGTAVRKGAHKTAPKPPSVGDIVTQWGFSGSWAVDCAMPAATDNGYNGVVRRGEDALLERDFGGRKDLNKVVSAKVLSNGALELRIEFAELSQTREMALTKGADGRIRTLSNRDTKGGYTVLDGKFVGSGGTTPWQSRCP